MQTALSGSPTGSSMINENRDCVQFDGREVNEPGEEKTKIVFTNISFCTE